MYTDIETHSHIRVYFCLQNIEDTGVPPFRNVIFFGLHFGAGGSNI
jgi:hypothetical protein